MAMQIEVKDKEAFIELQGKLMDFSRNMSQVKQKIQNTEKEKRRNELTLKEIEDLPASTRTYKSIGKTFLLTPSKELKDELAQNCTKADAELGGLVTQAKYIEKQINETEASVKELIVSVHRK